MRSEPDSQRPNDEVMVLPTWHRGSKVVRIVQIRDTEPPGVSLTKVQQRANKAERAKRIGIYQAYADRGLPIMHVRR